MGPQTYQLVSFKCPTSAETLQGQNDLGLANMRISSVPSRHHLYTFCDHQHESALLWPPCTIQFCSTLGSIAQLLTTQLFQDPGFSVPSFNEWATGGYCRYFIVLEYLRLRKWKSESSALPCFYLTMWSIQLPCEQRIEVKDGMSLSRAFLWHTRDPFFTLHGVSRYFSWRGSITTSGVWSLF